MNVTPSPSFRPLCKGDFALLHRWLMTPHVRDTYGLGQAWTPARIREKYLPLVEGRIATRAFVIGLDGRDAGYIQTYRILDHERAARQIGVDDEAHGIDLFIGEADLMGHGLGPLVIARFAAERVFAMTDAVAIVSDPNSWNRRSWRAFEKAGFRVWRKVKPVEEGCGDLLMRLERPRT